MWVPALLHDDPPGNPGRLVERDFQWSWYARSLTWPDRPTRGARQHRAHHCFQSLLAAPHRRHVVESAARDRHGCDARRHDRGLARAGAAHGPSRELPASARAVITCYHIAAAFFLVVGEARRRRPGCDGEREDRATLREPPPDGGCGPLIPPDADAHCRRAAADDDGHQVVSAPTKSWPQPRRAQGSASTRGTPRVGRSRPAASVQGAPAPATRIQAAPKSMRDHAPYSAGPFGQRRADQRNAHAQMTRHCIPQLSDCTCNDLERSMNIM